MSNDDYLNLELTSSWHGLYNLNFDESLNSKNDWENVTSFLSKLIDLSRSISNLSWLNQVWALIKQEVPHYEEICKLYIKMESKQLLKMISFT